MGKIVTEDVMDFKTYLRAKELAEYHAIVLYDDAQLDSQEWKLYVKRQRQAKAFTRRVRSVYQEAEARAATLEAEYTRANERMMAIADGYEIVLESLHAKENCAATWKRKAKQLWEANEQIVVLSDDIVEKANGIKSENARLRAALEAVEYVMDASNTHEPQFSHDRDECPWCFGERRNGHEPGCLRQKALKGAP